jgi:hypothetical protein
MKRLTNSLLPAVLFTVMLIFTINTSIMGQPPSPPPGLTSSGQSSNGQEQSPTAPIGGGLSIFLVLGAIYIAQKKLKSSENE